MRQSFAQSGMTLVRMNDVSNNAFINIDETAVIFYSHSNYTVSEEGAKTLSVPRGSCAKKRCTVCIAVVVEPGFTNRIESAMIQFVK